MGDFIDMVTPEGDASVNATNLLQLSVEVPLKQHDHDDVPHKTAAGLEAAPSHPVTLPSLPPPFCPDGRSRPLSPEERQKALQKIEHACKEGVLSIPDYFMRPTRFAVAAAAGALPGKRPI